MAVGGSLRLSWRIAFGRLESDAAFEQLLALVRAHRGVIDELALFDDLVHAVYIPLEEVARRAELLARRIRALKELGVPSVGINVLATIGHADEGLDIVPEMPFPPMVGHDGAISKGCACPNSAEFREYIRQKYTLMAQAEPDFIWVDDDIRMHHHGAVDYGCFCPICLELFAQQVGRHYSREALVAALNDPAQARLRRAWIERNIRTIESLLQEIGQTVRRVNPQITLGLMTNGPGWTTYSGVALERWFTALGATKARPGGGFYSDANRLGIISKALELGRQRAALPKTVDDCQYELENFPYQLLKKAARSVVHEGTLALAVGLNGVAFNALGMWGANPPDEFAGILERVHEVRPLWERLVAHIQNLPTVGLWPAWTPQLMARRRLRPGEDWFAEDRLYQIGQPTVLAEIGLPLSVERMGSPAILAGRVAEAFSKAQLRAMLAKGALLDSVALEVLEKLGLGELAGVRLARRYDNGVLERFTQDPLNGEYAHQVRDARIDFFWRQDRRGMADVLEPLDPNVRVLATLETYTGQGLGPCMTAFENPLGGRVVVMGYSPWQFIHSLAKRNQLVNVADWLSRGELPVRIKDPVPLTPFVRMARSRRRGLIVLLNHGLETIPQVRIEVRSPMPVRLAEPWREILFPQEQGGELILHNIPPWSTVCLFVGKVVVP
ncbi:MAG: hypothetical protein J7M05_08800 [Anaerolineae bacterium]|nr:hypothetical protein [Anaerolineae bacterium]